METNHTPGPWEIKSYDSSKPKKSILEIESDGKCISTPDIDFRTPEEAIANSKLIAHAPNMLLALQQINLLCVTTRTYGEIN